MFVAVCVALAFTGIGSPDFFATIALVVLAATAVHREAVYADETALSGSIVVICACIVGLSEASLLPPILCGVAAALHREHLRDRQILKVSVNLCATVVPALVASIAYRGIGTQGMAQVLGALCAVALYWLLNNAIVGASLGLLRGSGVGGVCELVRSDTVMLVFGLGGALCGLVMIEVGILVGLATLVALLVALDVFVISSPGRLVDLKAAWMMVVTRGVSGGVAGTVGALVTRAASVSVLGAFTGLMAGIAAGIAVVAVMTAVRLIARYGQVDVATLGGLAVAESAVPVMAAVSGVVTAIAGLDVGLFVASGLVLGASAIVAVRRRRAARRPRVTDEDALMAAVVEAMMDGLPAHER